MTTYVEIEHTPGQWVRARVDKQWRNAGCWRLSVYFYVGLLQHFEVFDADQCRRCASYPMPPLAPAADFPLR